jgi:hypothetical protein
MKVAITCDTILERSHYTEIVESLCEVFPDATLYCFAHKPKAVLGTIEQRPIRSTYLSKIVSTNAEFYQHSNKLPSLAKNLFVSCDYDLIVNVSRGFSQGFKKCEKTKIVTYLYDLDYQSQIRKTFLQKLFFPFIDSWIKKTLMQTDVLLTSREDLTNFLKQYKKDSIVIPPPFRISDYALFPKEMFKHHFFLVEANGLDLDQAEQVCSWMKEWGYAFQFIGSDQHLNSMKGNYSENTFFGSRCSGEHTPVLASAKAYITFNRDEFPSLALGTLATGRPVIIHQALTKWLSGVGVEVVDHLDKNLLKKAIDSLPNDQELEPQKLRAHSVFYHDIKFKSAMKRTLDKALHDLDHPSDCAQCN